MIAILNYNDDIFKYLINRPSPSQDFDFDVNYWTVLSSFSYIWSFIWKTLLDGRPKPHATKIWWKLLFLAKPTVFKQKSVGFGKNCSFQLKTTDLELNRCESTFSFTFESGIRRYTSILFWRRGVCFHLSLWM